MHTHSEYATMLAQARTAMRCMGTTHADYFRGDIPVTRPMPREEVDADYESNTGLVIVETFRAPALSPDEVPAVLVVESRAVYVGRSASAQAIERATCWSFWRGWTSRPE